MILPAQAPARKSRKDQSGRSRVTRACDACKRCGLSVRCDDKLILTRLKAKCDGQYPCSRCNRVQESCQYDMPYRRGRVPQVPQSTDFNFRECLSPRQEPTRSSTAEFASTLQSTSISNTSQSPSFVRNEPYARSVSQTSNSFSRNERLASERSQYLGDASGISFSADLRKILVDQNTVEDNFMEERLATQDLVAMRYSTIDRPSQSLATTWVNTYFDFAMPTYRLLHRARLTSALNRSYMIQEVNTMQDSLFYSIYALGVIYDRSSGVQDPLHKKEQAYKLHREAQRLKVTKNRTFSLVTAQADFLTCLYYLTTSMFGDAWMAVGSLARSIQAIGLHRSSMVTDSLDFDVEDGRRLFWCAYCLDRYLSAMLGRPNAFHDRDIDVELPSLVSDSQDTRIDGLNSIAPSLMTAAVAHFRLAKIVGCITSDIYGPQCKDPKSVIVGLRARVHEWAAQLPSYLSPHSEGRLPLLPTYARQASVLNLAYWHAVLSLNRSYVVLRTATPISDASFVSEAQEQALEAAQRIAGSVGQIHESGHYTFGFWFTSYIAFSASLVMVVSTSQLLPNDVRAISLDRSITSCVLFLETVGRINRVTNLYYKVVQSIRNAVRQNTQQVQNAMPDDVVDFDWSWFDETFTKGQATTGNTETSLQPFYEHDSSYRPQNPRSFQSPADVLEAYVIRTTT